MSSLTPARWRDFEARSAPRRRRYLQGPFSTCAAQVSSLTPPSLQSLPSPTTPCPHTLAPTLSVMGFPLARAWLAFQSQARQSARPNRVACATRRLRHFVAPHLTRGNAVTVGSRPERILKRTCHLLGWNALASARSPGQSRAMTAMDPTLETGHLTCLAPMARSGSASRPGRSADPADDTLCKRLRTATTIAAITNRHLHQVGCEYLVRSRRCRRNASPALRRRVPAHRHSRGRIHEPFAAVAEMRGPP